MAGYLIDPGKRRANRPTTFYGIDWSHPHARGLIGATPTGVAVDVELVSGRPLTRFGSPTVRGTRFSQALDVSGGNDRGAFLAATPPMKAMTECTIFWWGVQLAAASANAGLVGVTHNSGGAAPFVTAMIGRASGVDRVQLSFNNGTSFQFYQTSFPLGAGTEPQCLIATIKSGTQQLYWNGVAVGGTGTVAIASLAAGATAEWVVGSDHFGAGRNSGAATLDARLYNRAISESEAFAMGSDPRTMWDLYARPSTRVYFDIGAAATFNPAWARGSNIILGAGVHQ